MHYSIASLLIINRLLAIVFTNKLKVCFSAGIFFKIIFFMLRMNVNTYKQPFLFITEHAVR
jgi:hypothetical protein